VERLLWLRKNAPAGPRGDRRIHRQYPLPQPDAARVGLVAVVVRHHDVQVKGRDTVLADYRLRVGQITGDTDVPPGQTLQEQRLDVTDIGDGKAITLINSRAPVRQGPLDEAEATSLAKQLGLRTDAGGLVEWDIFDSVLEPGNPILLQAWADPHNATSVANDGQKELRHREIRVIRDYGMFDRRENPQYYPDVPRPTPAE
jgi:hypothetical protein